MLWVLCPFFCFLCLRSNLSYARGPVGSLFVNAEPHTHPFTTQAVAPATPSSADAFSFLTPFKKKVNIRQLWADLSPLRAVDLLERRNLWASTLSVLEHGLLPSRHAVPRCHDAIQTHFKAPLDDSTLEGEKDNTILTAWSISHVQHDAFDFFRSRHLIRENPVLPAFCPCARGDCYSETLGCIFKGEELHPEAQYRDVVDRTGVVGHLSPKAVMDAKGGSSTAPQWLPLSVLRETEPSASSEAYRPSVLWSLYSRAHSFDEYLEEERQLQQKAIQASLCWAWTHHRLAGLGSPEVDPMTRRPVVEWSGLPVTLIDALDTLWIADFPLFFHEGVSWLRSHGTVDVNGDVNLFETTIRVLGGLLSAHLISKDTALLSLAHTLGTKLLNAFAHRALFAPRTSVPPEHPVAHYCWLIYNSIRKRNVPPPMRQRQLKNCLKSARNFTVTRLPASDVALLRGNASNLRGHSTLAEVGSLQLEFMTLSRHTGDCRFHDNVDSVIELLEAALNVSWHGVVPSLLLQWGASPLVQGSRTLGSRGDSFYEYLIKEWILTNRSDPLLPSMIQGVLRSLSKKFLRQKPAFTLDANASTWAAAQGPRNGGLAPAEMMAHPITIHAVQPLTNVTEVDHLTCFLPGLLGLWVAHARPSDYPKNGVDPAAAHRMAVRLLNSCVVMYFRTVTGLAPEITEFDMSQEGTRSVRAVRVSRFSLLRPETVESLFVMHRLTKNPKYRQWGWRIALAMLRYGAGPYGFANVRDVEETPGTLGALDWQGLPIPPRQHTWIFAETLKYLYLLFTDDWELEDRLRVFDPSLTPANDTLHFAEPKPTTSILHRVLFNTEAHLFPASLPNQSCGRVARLKVRHQRANQTASP